MQRLPIDQPNPGLERTHHQLRASGAKDEIQNPLRSGIHTRGYLPHVKREGASYFVTFRLADSLPREVLLDFEREKAKRLRRLQHFKSCGETINDSEQEIARDFGHKVERYLDRGVGACHLRQPEIADLVANAMRHFQESRYVLHEWVVMPNHTHAILLADAESSAEQHFEILEAIHLAPREENPEHGRRSVLAARIL